MTDTTQETDTPAPVVRDTDGVSTEPVDAADGLTKAVLVDETDGASSALRRFRLAPGASVPRHTNAVEHVQYVLAGEYTVGIDGTEHTVSAADALFVPAGAVHWYENDGDDPGVFLCVVPAGDDEIRLVDD